MFSKMPREKAYEQVNFTREAKEDVNPPGNERVGRASRMANVNAVLGF